MLCAIFYGGYSGIYIFPVIEWCIPRFIRTRNFRPAIPDLERYLSRRDSLMEEMPGGVGIVARITNRYAVI